MQDQATQHLKKIVDLILVEIFTYFKENPQLKMSDAISFILDCMMNSTFNIVLSLKRLLPEDHIKNINFELLMQQYENQLPEILNRIKNYKPLRDTDIEIH